ncbi:hypothetical protein HK100_001823 [Physocladia obscura]|uniref:Uncharacterized protein n=1 Tax=Physocladia obscura TaxID=109957 RepID=A0AAD5SW91_9FUNG|nr:hypothetical protein HK100_001823 [Physocladia obscura]
MIDKVKEFYVFSWEKCKYVTAVKEYAFFVSVKGSLDTSDTMAKIDSGLDSNSEILDCDCEVNYQTELVESKFDFAGSFSWFIFLFLTAKIIQHLKDKNPLDCLKVLPDYLTMEFSNTKN